MLGASKSGYLVGDGVTYPDWVFFIFYMNSPRTTTCRTRRAVAAPLRRVPRPYGARPQLADFSRRRGVCPGTRATRPGAARACTSPGASPEIWDAPHRAIRLLRALGLPLLPAQQAAGSFGALKPFLFFIDHAHCELKRRRGESDDRSSFWPRWHIDTSPDKLIPPLTPSSTPGGLAFIEPSRTAYSQKRSSTCTRASIGVETTTTQVLIGDLIAAVEDDSARTKDFKPGTNAQRHRFYHIHQHGRNSSRLTDLIRSSFRRVNVSGVDDKEPAASEPPVAAQPAARRQLTWRASAPGDYGTI